MNSNNLKYINIFWSSILLFLIISSILNYFISADAVYYLSIAKDISNGLIPYKDIYISYTPIVMYFKSIVYFLFSNPTIHYFIIFHYIIISLSSICLYLISRHFKINKKLSFFIIILFFIAILLSDSIYINLEVYVILFVFLAFWLLLKKTFVLSGFFITISFFCKQYGVLNFFPFVLLTIYFYKFDKQNLIRFCLGCAIPVLLFFLYYVFIEEISFNHLMRQLSGKGYGENGKGYGESYFLQTISYKKLIFNAKVFILLLVVLGSLLIIPFKNKINLIMYFGILINLIPILIQSFPHYFILSYPYIFILIIINSNRIDYKFFITSNISLIFISSFLYFKQILPSKGAYQKQLELASKYRKKYPNGSKVYLVGYMQTLYLLNDYKNPVFLMKNLEINTLS